LPRSLETESYVFETVVANETGLAKEIIRLPRCRSNPSGLWL